MKYALLYVFSVVLVNYAFDVAPRFALPGGELWSPVPLAVGFIFIIRDYAQREIGHLILPAMLIGGLASWIMATPEIALASVCAFLTSEIVDWAAYTFTGRPFSQRILLSSCLSTPLDSIVFLSLIGLFSVPSVLVMTVSKMAGAVIIYFLARRREVAALSH